MSGKLPTASVFRALVAMRMHPAVAKVHEPTCTTHGTSVQVDMRVQMPQQWIADGKSPSGVRAVEPIVMTFAPDFPDRALRLFLRMDFDRSLAHVQPGGTGRPPEPCILYGSLDEFFQQRGIDGILNQLSDWLSKAAHNALIDPNQGWEPVRRDTLPDTVIADLRKLEKHIGGTHGKTFLGMYYWRFHEQRRTSILYGSLDEQVSLNAQGIDKLVVSRNRTEEIEEGFSVAALVWPAKKYIADKYLPETVTTLGELRQRAQLYGCEDALNAAIDHLRISFKGYKGHTVPVLLILCARRPFALIGTTSLLEFCMYRIDANEHTPFPDGNKTPVYPAGQRDTVTQDLLRRVSGVAKAGASWTLLGAGSLGSKIALHLTRAGLSPSCIIDRDDLEAHNAARHALLPQAGALLMRWRGNKAEHLADALRSFDTAITNLNEDVRGVLADPTLLAKAFANSRVVVNATASLVVREVLAKQPSQRITARVLEAGLFANGRAGVVTLEGENRNPNTGYLIAEVYQLMRNQAQHADFFGTTGTTTVPIGQGCSSATFIMSDAQISAHAAPMAGELQRLLTDGLPVHGHVQIGFVEGMGTLWSTHDVPPCHIFSPDHNPDWHVHVSDRAHKKIAEEISRWPTVETGGLLVGSFSDIAQAFYITDVLPAPEDSTRSAALFTLGTKGVKAALLDLAKATNGAVYCLGTWHSHLAASGPSNIDRDTAQAISVSQLLPAVLVIRTPVGYRAALAAQT